MVTVVGERREETEDLELSGPPATPRPSMPDKDGLVWQKTQTVVQADREEFADWYQKMIRGEAPQ